MTINNTTHTNNDLLTPEETVSILRLKSKHTLEVWRSVRRYPELEWIKVGRLIRYRRSAVERFLEQRTISDSENNFVQGRK